MFDERLSRRTFIFVQRICDERLSHRRRHTSITPRFFSCMSTPVLGTFSAPERGDATVRRCCAPAVTRKLGTFSARKSTNKMDFN